MFSSPPALGLERFAKPKPTVYRGVVVSAQTRTAARYVPDGGVGVDGDGRIVAVGQLRHVRRVMRDQYGAHVEVVDLTSHGEAPILLPGLADAHIHWVQHAVRGKFDSELLPWLRTWIWPHEHEYRHYQFAREHAAVFWSDLVRMGTVMSAVYSSIHENALAAAFEEAIGYSVIGNVVMTRNCPRYLQQSPEAALQLIRRSARKYGPSYGPGPRFAPNVGMRTMRPMGDIVSALGLFVQTHLDENRNEIKWIERLFGGDSYAYVYWLAGLLGPKTIMGHVIHTRKKELELLKRTGTVVAHAPDSNVRLHSGRMKYERLREMGLRVALASDVGAGATPSMLFVMKVFLDVHRPHTDVHPIEALYLATVAGADALTLTQVAGGIDVGRMANMILIKSPGTTMRPSANRLLSDVLDGSQGDLENAVQQTVIEGRVVYEAA